MRTDSLTPARVSIVRTGTCTVCFAYGVLFRLTPALTRAGPTTPDMQPDRTAGVECSAIVSRWRFKNVHNCSCSTVCLAQKTDRRNRTEAVLGTATSLHR